MKLILFVYLSSVHFTTGRQLKFQRDPFSDESVYLLKGHRRSHPLSFRNNNDNPNRNSYFKSSTLNMMVDSQPEIEYANPQQRDAFLLDGYRHSHPLSFENNYDNPNRNSYLKSSALNMMVVDTQPETEYANAQQRDAFLQDGYRHRHPLSFENNYDNPNRNSYLKSSARNMMVDSHPETEYANAQQQDAFLKDGIRLSHPLSFGNNYDNPNKNSYFKSPTLSMMVDSQPETEYANADHRDAFLLDGNRLSHPLSFGNNYDNPNRNSYLKSSARNVMVDSQPETEYANAQQRDAFLQDGIRLSHPLSFRNNDDNPIRNSYFKSPTLHMMVDSQSELEYANADQRDAFLLDGNRLSHPLSFGNNYDNPNRNSYLKSSARNVMVDSQPETEYANAQQRDAFLLDGYSHSHYIPFGNIYDNPNRNPFFKSPAIEIKTDNHRGDGYAQTEQRDTFVLDGYRHNPPLRNSDYNINGNPSFKSPAIAMKMGNHQETEYARTQQRDSDVRIGWFPRHNIKRSKTYLPDQETKLLKSCASFPCVLKTRPSRTDANYGPVSKQHDTYDNSAKMLMYDTQKNQILQYPPSEKTHTAETTSYRTSMQRPDVASTLVRRCFNIVCLLGNASPPLSITKRKAWSQYENQRSPYTKRSRNWIRTRYGYWYYPYSYFDSRGPLDTLASQLIG